MDLAYWASWSYLPGTSYTPPGTVTTGIPGGGQVPASGAAPAVPPAAPAGPSYACTTLGLGCPADPAAPSLGEQIAKGLAKGLAEGTVVPLLGAAAVITVAYLTRKHWMKYL